MAEIGSEIVKNARRDEQVSEAVVAAVAEAKGVDPLELDPIYNVVDPDALDNLFHRTDDVTSSTLELAFSVAGCQVTVYGDGDVVVTRPLEGERRQSAVTPSDD